MIIPFQHTGYFGSFPREKQSPRSSSSLNLSPQAQC
jgi:hypothetical protein